MGKPKKVQRFRYISRAADVFLKIPLGEDFCSHLLGTRKLLRFELMPLHCQSESFTTCYYTNNRASKSNTNTNSVGQTTEELRSCKEPIRSCSDGIFLGQRVLGEIKTTESHKTEENTSWGFLRECSSPHQRDSSCYARLLIADCICTATSQ